MRPKSAAPFELPFPLPFAFSIMLSPSASLASLLAFCKSQARIESCDYFDPRFARPDEVAAWQSDKSRRDRQRKACFRLFPGRLRSAASEPLIPGSYGRLSISEDGSPSYVVGQYAPLEIFHALAAYLEATN
jgi:hypothetical protein